jgi:hypothetical protein
MFVESLGSGTLHNGIIRIEAKIVGGDGKEHVADHLVFPAQQAGQIMQQLDKILIELKKLVQDAGAKKAADESNH